MHKLVFQLGASCALLLFCLLSPVQAQSVRKLVKMGDDAFYAADFHGAVQQYEQAVKERPHSVRLRFRLGFSYLMLRSSGKALPHLRKAYQSGDRYQPAVSYLLAQAYHLQHKLDSAIYFYHQFEVELDDENYPEFEVVEKNLQECRNGLAFMKRPAPVIIENLGPSINSPYADFVPVINADETLLIFTSRRTGNLGKPRPKGEPEAFEDIYYSRKEKGLWGPA